MLLEHFNNSQSRLSQFLLSYHNLTYSYLRLECECVIFIIRLTFLTITLSLCGGRQTDSSWWVWLYCTVQPRSTLLIIPYSLIIYYCHHMNYHHTIFTSPSSCTAASQQFQHLSHLVTAAVGCVIFNLVSVIYLRQRFDLLLSLCTGGLVMLSLHQGQRGCSWPLSLYIT